ncbi:MAG: MaoC family dehydratase [Candidatus Aenigmatarchaeota archaeon]
MKIKIGFDGQSMDRFNTIKIGDRASFSKTILETDLVLFMGICGDFNPIHTDARYAEKTIFKGRIVHGLLTASLISTVIGMHLPGPGTVYLSQELKFLKPVRIGDTLTANAEVLEKREDKRILTLRTWVTNQDGVDVIDGKAVVMLLRDT